MMPVAQTKLADPTAFYRGNCFAACVASIFEVPIWMVPPFEDETKGRTMAELADDWVRRMFNQRILHTDGHHPEQLPEFYIANGKSPRGVLHSVIYRRGELAHDPHPSHAGIARVDWTWHFEAWPSKEIRDAEE